LPAPPVPFWLVGTMLDLQFFYSLASPQSFRVRSRWEMMHNLVHILSLSGTQVWLLANFSCQNTNRSCYLKSWKEFCHAFFYRYQSAFNLAASVFNLATPEQFGPIANTAGDFCFEAGVDALCNLPSISQQSHWQIYQCREQQGSARESEFR